MIDRLQNIFGGKEPSDQFYPSSKELEKSLNLSSHCDEIISYIESHGGSVRKDLLKWPRNRGGMLPDIGILRHFLAGNIKIEPFDVNHLQSAGYDVSVGPVHFRKKSIKEIEDEGSGKVFFDDKTTPIYDPYSKESIELMWAGPLDTTPAKTMKDSIHLSLKGGGEFFEKYGDHKTFGYVDNKDELIFIKPNEMILASTIEQIGGKNVLTTMIAGRSTPARHGFEICSDAFLGDVGFTYNWVLEIVNKHPDATVYLAVGTPLATIIFQELPERSLQQYKSTYTDQGTRDDMVKRLLPKPMKSQRY